MVGHWNTHATVRRSRLGHVVCGTKDGHSQETHLLPIPTTHWYSLLRDCIHARRCFTYIHNELESML